MSKITVILPFFLLFIGNFAFSQTPKEAEIAAKDAIRRLEEVLSGGSQKTTSTGNQTAVISVPPPPAQVTRGGRQPAWVDDPYNVYNRNHFIAVVGSGPNRDQAEAKALSALVSFFGQSIKSDLTVITKYTEAVNNGVVSVSNNTNVRDAVTRAASMEKLIGAEIGSIWDNSRGTVYAIAYLDKARTVSIYTDMVIVNNHNINLLTTMSNIEKNTLDGYARYKLASLMTEINTEYANIITLAGGSIDSLNIRSFEFYNIEAANIIRNITVSVQVSNDRANRIQDAFAKVIGNEGLRTRGNNPRYKLEVLLIFNEVTFQGNDLIFCRLEASANLVDITTGESLLAFNFNDRAGHTSYANAQTMVYTNAEKIITDRYKKALHEYIVSLMPANK